jgi:hypothetical protein
MNTKFGGGCSNNLRGYELLGISFECVLSNDVYELRISHTGRENSDRS